MKALILLLAVVIYALVLLVIWGATRFGGSEAGSFGNDLFDYGAAAATGALVLVLAVVTWIC